MLSVRKAETRSLFGCALLLFVMAAGQSPVSPEILMTAYNPGMCFLALPVTAGKFSACGIFGRSWKAMIFTD